MDASSFKNMVGVGGMVEYDHDPLSKFFDTDRREVAVRNDFQIRRNHPQCQSGSQSSELRCSDDAGENCCPASYGIRYYGSSAW